MALYIRHTCQFLSTLPPLELVPDFSMVTSYVLKYLPSLTICWRQTTIALSSSNLQLQTLSLHTDLHTGHTRICAFLPASLPPFLPVSIVGKLHNQSYPTLCTSGPRTCCTVPFIMLHTILYINAMQVSRMLPSLPRILPCIQETYSRISQVNNPYGQLKGQFNVGHGRSWSFTRRSEVGHTNGLFFGARRAVAYPSVPMIRPNICTQAPMRSKVWQQYQQFNTFRRKVHTSPRLSILLILLLL